MIRRLRNRFIRIATLSVAAVMMLLTVILNTANYISTDSDLVRTLEMIEQNQGTIPLPMGPNGPGAAGNDGAEAPAKPDKQPGQRNGPFGPKAAFSTRFFVLRYTQDGTLTGSELDRIAAVTEDDVAEYLAVALRHGAGFGYYSGYK